MQVVTKAKIISVKNYSDELKEYIIAPVKYRRYNAGTFLQLTLDNVTASDYWPESRTFSIASNYNKEDKVMKLIIKRSGKYTTRIFDELLVGKECTIKYSFGDMILPQFDNQDKVVCIAAGSGIAPFLGFIEELEGKDMLDRIELFYTVRYEKDFISYDYLRNKLKKHQMHFFCTDEKSLKGENRLMNINEILEDKNFLEKHYYICGSPDFINFFREGLLKRQIKKIYLDEWE